MPFDSTSSEKIKKDLDKDIAQPSQGSVECERMHRNERHDGDSHFRWKSNYRGKQYMRHKQRRADTITPAHLMRSELRLKEQIERDEMEYEQMRAEEDEFHDDLMMNYAEEDYERSYLWWHEDNHQIADNHGWYAEADDFVDPTSYTDFDDDHLTEYSF